MSAAQERHDAFQRELETAVVADARQALGRFLEGAMSLRLTSAQVAAALCDVVDEAMARGLTLRRVHELIQPAVLEMAPSLGRFTYWVFAHARGDVNKALGRDFRDRAGDVLYGKPGEVGEPAPPAADDTGPRRHVHRDIYRVMATMRAKAPSAMASRLRAAVTAAVVVLVAAVGVPLVAPTTALANPGPPVRPQIMAPPQVVSKLDFASYVPDPDRPLWRVLLDPKITAETWDGD
jgi:hypothetical protein